MSLPRQPLHPGTCLLPSKIAGELKPKEVPAALCGAVRPHNGSWRTPPALPISENIQRYVEDFDELRTRQAEFFSILLEGPRPSVEEVHGKTPSCHTRCKHGTDYPA